MLVTTTSHAVVFGKHTISNSGIFGRSDANVRFRLTVSKRSEDANHTP
jgi:hypothetical protein